MENDDILMIIHVSSLKALLKMERIRANSVLRWHWLDPALDIPRIQDLEASIVPGLLCI